MPYLLLLAGMAVATGAYLQVLDTPFLFDDSAYITGNTRLSGLHVADLWRLFVEPYNPYEFLPLRDFSYWVDLKLYGRSPSAFRIHNILLYLACCLFLFGATRSLWCRLRPVAAASATWVAVSVTVIFAVHPAHVEAVVWASGRKDVLSGMFAMLALWLASSAMRERGLSIPHAIAALLMLLAAIFSKATAVAVAPIIALLWLILWRDIPGNLRRYTTLLWPSACLFVAFWAAKVFVDKSLIKDPAYLGVETIDRTLSILGWFARLAISPEGRHSFYPVFDESRFSLMAAFGLVVLLLVVGGVVISLRKRDFAIEGFALFSFALLCIPYFQIIPYRTYSLVADRFLFLSVWPVILLGVSLAWRLSLLPRAVVLLVFALPLCYQTIVRPRDWKSYDALIEADVRAYPGHYIPAIYKAMTIQLPNALFNEAYVTVSAVKDVQIREMLQKELYANHAVFIEAVETGNPGVAIARIKDFESALQQPPEQIKWNPPVRWAWERSRTTVSYLWRYLASRFPGNEDVRKNAVTWMERH